MSVDVRANELRQLREIEIITRHIPAKIIERIYNLPATIDEVSAEDLSLEYSIPIDTFMSVVNKTCRKCKALKPPGAHHCKICGSCVARMDHHCPWVNNCVGAGNHKQFMLFLFYTFIGSLHAFIMIFIKCFQCYFMVDGECAIF